MKPTVTKAVSGRPVKAESLEDWANKEVVPVLQQLRAASNFSGVERAEVTTAGAGVATVIWTSPEMPTDASWLVTATVTGLSVSGVERAGIVVNVTTQSTAGGAVTQVGTTNVSTHVTTVGIAASFAVVGRTVTLSVNDGGTGAMTFVALVDTTEARFS